MERKRLPSKLTEATVPDKVVQQARMFLLGLAGNDKKVAIEIARRAIGLLKEKNRLV